MFRVLINTFFISFLVFFLLVQQSQAIQVVGNKENIEVELDDKTKISLRGRGEAIRHKKVALFNIKVYQVRLFFNESLSATKTAKDLISAKEIGVKLNPLRSFGGDKLKEAMLVSYEKNKIDSNSKSQKEFFNIISKHKIEKNVPVYLVGFSKPDGDELHLVMKDINKKIKGHPGFVKEVFSVWLGEPVDADMTKVQDILVK